MQVVKVTIVDDEGKEQELAVKDGTLLLLCDEDKILTQTTTNPAVNLELMRKILSGK
jgi:hypothetical protein